MTEFVTLVALGVLVSGLAVLAAGFLLAAIGWLVVRSVRPGWPAGSGTRGEEHRRPG
jgi:hypothetical protein